MAEPAGTHDDPQALRYFQLYQLFDHDQLDAVLGRPEWAARYPEAVAEWKSTDKLKSSQALIPGEMVRAIARETKAIGDVYADADGQTLHMVTPGTRPFRFHKDPSGKTVVEDIVDATKLPMEQAIVDYGADAVWLAQEYGQSRRGERDDRFRRNWQAKATP
jgi:hypothetical protein